MPAGRMPCGLRALDQRHAAPRRAASRGGRPSSACAGRGACPRRASAARTRDCARRSARGRGSARASARARRPARRPRGRRPGRREARRSERSTAARQSSSLPPKWYWSSPSGTPARGSDLARLRALEAVLRERREGRPQDPLLGVGASLGCRRSRRRPGSRLVSCPRVDVSCGSVGQMNNRTVQLTNATRNPAPGATRGSRGRGFNGAVASRWPASRRGAPPAGRRRRAPNHRDERPRRRA